jgi:hypothetical protein
VLGGTGLEYNQNHGDLLTSSLAVSVHNRRRIFLFGANSGACAVAGQGGLAESAKRWARTEGGYEFKEGVATYLVGGRVYKVQTGAEQTQAHAQEQAPSESGGQKAATTPDTRL